MSDIQDADDLPEIDPAVYDNLEDKPSFAARSRVARLWYEECGRAPFTVVTMIAYAQDNGEMRDALLDVAPDRFGFGAISQNMLTRWFKSQEGRPIAGSATRTTTMFLRTMGLGIWQYDRVSTVEGDPKF